MIVWMRHDRHGVMPCSNVLEVENNKKAGWVEFNPESTPSHKIVQRDVVKEYTQKYGKPPHHRMKAESILQALEQQ